MSDLAQALEPEESAAALEGVGDAEDHIEPGRIAGIRLECHEFAESPMADHFAAA